MKNPHLCRVGFSESRFRGRQEETTTATSFSKPDVQTEDRPERMLPYHSPHGLYTDEELKNFISGNQDGGLEP